MKSLISNKALFIVLGILVAPVIACGGDDAPKPQDPEGSAEATVSSKALFAEGTPAPMLPESVRDYAFKNIMMNREVLESEIIDRAASETTSKSLGNRLLRVVKRSGPDQTPTKKEIDAADFDYLIDGPCSDGSTIAQGKKVSDSSEIIW